MYLAQGYPGVKWWSSNLNPGSLVPEPTLVTMQNTVPVLFFHSLHPFPTPCQILQSSFWVFWVQLVEICEATTPRKSEPFKGVCIMTPSGRRQLRPQHTLTGSVRGCRERPCSRLHSPQPPLAFRPRIDHRIDERARPLASTSICLMHEGGGSRAVHPPTSPRTLQPEAFLGERREGHLPALPPSVHWGGPGA